MKYTCQFGLELLYRSGQCALLGNQLLVHDSIQMHVCQYQPPTSLLVTFHSLGDQNHCKGPHKSQPPFQASQNRGPNLQRRRCGSVFF